MDLRKYTDDDFNLLNSWITDADLLFQFAGTVWTFPLTRKQMQDYQGLHPDNLSNKPTNMILRRLLRAVQRLENIKKFMSFLLFFT